MEDGECGAEDGGAGDGVGGGRMGRLGRLRGGKKGGGWDGLGGGRRGRRGLFVTRLIKSLDLSL